MVARIRRFFCLFYEIIKVKNKKGTCQLAKRSIFDGLVFKIVLA
jgi:hypothetical protein